MLTVESASEGLHAIHISIIYNAWDFCIIYSFGGQRCAVHALHAPECPHDHCTATESTEKALAVTAYSLVADACRQSRNVYNPGHIVTGNSGEYMYL